MNSIDFRRITFNNAVERLIAQIPNNLSEIEKARYVYLELGKLICYDEKYWFGTSEIQHRIYKKSLNSTPSFSEIQENKKKKAICISISKLYSSILQEIGIKAGQQNENDHFYSYLIIKDKLYYADLNNDMKYIQLELPTSFFFTEGANVLSKDRLQQIDEKLGYHYKGIYNFKSKINMIKTKFKNLNALSDKMQCIFDLGSEIPGVKDLELIERNFVYRKLALKTLSDKEFGKLQALELYEVQKDEKDSKNRINYQTVYVTRDFNSDLRKETFSYFVFSQYDRKYKKISTIELLDFIDKNNLTFKKIPGLINNHKSYEETKRRIAQVYYSQNAGEEKFTSANINNKKLSNMNTNNENINKDNTDIIDDTLIK